MPNRTTLFLFLAAVTTFAAQPSIAAATTAVTSTSWVYYNGAFDWPTDYSFSAYPDYADMDGDPRSGAHDIKVQITSAYGGWAPVAKNHAFDGTAYNRLTVTLKPTVANQKWKIYFGSANGGSLGANCARDVSGYGPAPVAGEWATYTIPLSDLCVAGDAKVYKFVVQDTSGLSDNTWYVDDVGFEAVTNVAGETPVATPAPILAPAPDSTPGPTVIKSASSGGTSWVYYNGNFNWPGDYSWSASANYKDTNGQPLSGDHDMKLSLQGPYGGWQPWAPNRAFNTSGYSKLTFALKPRQQGQRWRLSFELSGDRGLGSGCNVNVTDYGPAPVVGKWATYTVPLSRLCVSNRTIYKFAIQDMTGSSYNSWYVDNVGFAR